MKKRTPQAGPRKKISRKTFARRKSPAAKALQARRKRLPNDLSDARPAPAADPQATNETAQLPHHYGDDRIVLMIRDPWWIFSYWEITRSKYEATVGRMKAEGQAPAVRVLRVYDVYGVSVPEAHGSFDIEVGAYSDNWYIDVGRPDSEWIVEIGLRSASGKFFAMARSNSVRTPRHGVSDVLDEEWMIPDDRFWKMMGRSLGTSPSSAEVHKGLRQHLKHLQSSERPDPAARHGQA